MYYWPGRPSVWNMSCVHDVAATLLTANLTILLHPLLSQYKATATDTALLLTSLNDYSFRAAVGTKPWDWKFSHYKDFKPNDGRFGIHGTVAGNLAPQQPFLLAIKPDRGGRKTTCWRVRYNTFPSSPPLPIPPFPFLIIHPSTPPKAPLFEAPHL